MASKTVKRNELLDSVVRVISHKDIYDTIDYKRRNEDFIKQFMYQPLLNEITNNYIKKGLKKETAVQKAKNSLVWESNKKTVLHNMVRFGCQHRPDMELNIDNIRIAIEVKKGGIGSDVRQGFGQCLVYSSNYDFVIFLFVDTSDDKRILNSMDGEKERLIGESLWKNFNALFCVV